MARTGHQRLAPPGTTTWSTPASRTPQVLDGPSDGSLVTTTDDIRTGRGDSTMEAMQRLSLVLWRERELLEELHYRLEVEQLVLASGRSRWLAHAARDIDALLT